MGSGKENEYYCDVTCSLCTVSSVGSTELFAQEENVLIVRGKYMTVVATLVLLAGTMNFALTAKQDSKMRPSFSFYRILKTR